jgi:IgGFc binding protein
MRDSTWPVVLLLVCPTFVTACGPAPRPPDGSGSNGSGADGSNLVCTPGTGSCNGNVGHACNSDGSGYVDNTCSDAAGESCNPNTGACSALCAPENLGSSYIGCDYYPTVTGNMVSSDYHYALAIANTTTIAANVTIDGGALGAPLALQVPASSVRVQLLPWQPNLKLCMGPSSINCDNGVQMDAALAAKGAYHLVSTAPVTVYQFNPLEYTLPGAGEINSYTNDASLLLPTNVWRQTYIAAAWEQTLGFSPSELAVTAQQDGTQVTITARANTVAAQGAPAFQAGVPQTVTLNAGDVIEITTRTGDLTGSLISSTKPVQLISGHFCAFVPDGIRACDHLEESMFSVDSLGKRYIVNAPAVTSIPSGKAEVVRVIATAPNTNLTFTPPQPGVPTTIANAGDYVQIANTAASFLIEGDQKILVSQYMEGQDAGGGTGDPAMALAVPLEQFRTSYLFHAPLNYESNYVDVTAPMGAAITLDGNALGFTPIGTTGYGLARVYPLGAGPLGDGNHSITGTMAFGITVYGYGQYTSYWYPGGLNLTDIIN